jgi:hypothetical protein
MYMPGALCRLALMFFVLNLVEGGVKPGYCDADLIYATARLKS